MIKNLSSMSSMSQGLSFLDLNQISEEDEQLLSQVLASGGNSDLLPPECRSALHQVEIYEDVTTPSQVEEEDGEVEEVEEQPLCPQQLPDTPDESSSLNQDINAEALPDQQQEGQAVVQDECSSTYSQPDDVKAAQGHCIPKGYGDGNEESPGPIQTSTQIADTPNTSSIPSAMTPALGSEFTPPQFGTGPAPFHPTSVVPVSHLSSHPTSHAGSFPLAQEPFVLESADDCTEGTSAQSDEQIAESPAQFSTPKVSEVKAVPNGSVEPQETPGEPELAAPAEIKPAVAPAPEAVILTTMSIPPPVIVASETQNQVVPEPSNTVAEEEVVPVLNKVVPNEPGKGFVAMKNVAEEVKVDIPVESQVVPESKVEEPKSSPQQTGIGAMKEEVPEVTPVPPGGAWAQKKSWSQLFKSPDGAPQKQVALVAPFKAEPVKLNAEEFPAGPSGTIVTPVCGQEPKMPEPLPIAQEDMDKAKIGEMLREYKHDHHQVALQPRGLINKGYWCYVNAPLQALLACPPFYNLMKNIPTPPIPKHGPSSTPVIDSIMTFVNEFSVMAPILKAGRKDKAAGGGRKEPEVVPGAPFEPAYVYKMLANINSELFAEGHQQDAEEMLSCVLNGLHDEMVEALKLAGGSDTCGSNGTLNGEQGFDAEEEEEEVEDEWKVMGPRKRSCVTRTAHFSPSPISAIFWGQLRSNLHQAGGHTTANLQPFTTLPLDIQSQRVESVHDALEQLVSREEITGYTCSKTHQEVAVSKQVMLEHLPQVLVLHLKRFIYDKDGGLQKVTKKVNFPVDLEVGKELMSSNSRGKFSTTQRRKYKLLAVVYHDGKEATKGHYVADVFHGGYSCWLRYDDNQVKQVREADVLHHATPRVPYLLFYRRGDTMVGPSTRTK
ncbi:ubiquitin specific protease 10 isoform X2 [Oratosquilla oratoria]|uniref:ubiquitin specific protease 10 isoform X2 n=1 Tax=Oratosquilla oratoria TaxID=337810 RepID=UPI003F774CFA